MPGVWGGGRGEEQGLGSEIKHGLKLIPTQNTVDFTAVGSLPKSLHTGMVRIRSPIGSADHS